MEKQGRFFRAAGLAIIGLWIGFTLVASAETPPVSDIQTLKINRIEICPAIANKEPQGSAAKFKAGEVTRLYCYTEIEGAAEPTYVTHTWYYNNKQVVSIKLAVETHRWRNWSSKSILPAHKGNWKVEVATPDGKVLKSVDFLLE